MKCREFPDGVPDIFYRNTALFLALPLSLIFARSLSEAKPPDLWKCSIFAPVFKKGERSDVSNYRPIALTCISCKIFEKIIKEDMLSFLLANNLLSQRQYGFLPGRSTTTQLISTVNAWAINLNNRTRTDVIYVDFAKAFDVVDLNKLKFKLSLYGFGGVPLDWCGNFLHERKFCVKVGQYLSPSSMASSGVPQGCVLGPIFFLLYIDDLLLELETTEVSCFLFADDLKLFRGITCPADVASLQTALDRLHAWSEEWSLDISFQKCSVVQIGNPSDSTYTIDGTILHTNRTQRDLGVVVSGDLRFGEHISEICIKANRISNLILRTFDTLSYAPYIRLFCSVARPILE